MYTVWCAVMSCDSASNLILSDLMLILPYFSRAVSFALGDSFACHNAIEVNMKNSDVRAVSDPLWWRHNEPDSVSNLRRFHFCSTVCSGTDQTKHQSSVSLIFVGEYIDVRCIPFINNQQCAKQLHLMTVLCTKEHSIARNVCISIACILLHRIWELVAQCVN